VCAAFPSTMASHVVSHLVMHGDNVGGIPHPRPWHVYSTQIFLYHLEQA